MVKSGLLLVFWEHAHYLENPWYLMFSLIIKLCLSWSLKDRTQKSSKIWGQFIGYLFVCIYLTCMVTLWHPPPQQRLWELGSFVWELKSAVNCVQLANFTFIPHTSTLSETSRESKWQRGAMNPETEKRLSPERALKA